MSILKANGQFFKSIKTASKYMKSLEHDIKQFSFQISIIEFFNQTQEKNLNSCVRLA